MQIEPSNLPNAWEPQIPTHYVDSASSEYRDVICLIYACILRVSQSMIKCNRFTRYVGVALGMIICRNAPWTTHLKIPERIALNQRVFNRKDCGQNSTVSPLERHSGSLYHRNKFQLCFSVSKRFSLDSFSKLDQKSRLQRHHRRFLLPHDSPGWYFHQTATRCRRRLH